MGSKNKRFRVLETGEIGEFVGYWHRFDAEGNYFRPRVLVIRGEVRIFLQDAVEEVDPDGE